jgi:hypothetical protein
MVNSWLYCSLDRNCSPGMANSPRMNNAISPPVEKKTKQATTYTMPKSLWSVVVINL